MDRYNYQFEWENVRFGQLCALLANIYRDTKKKNKPYTPGDFFPITLDKKKKTEIKKLSPEEAIEYLRRQNAFAGGKEIING